MGEPGIPWLLVTGRRDEEERGWIRTSAGKPVWLDLHSTPYTKINSKEASDLNAKATMIKLSEINMGVLWDGGKTDKLDFIKTEDFCSLKKGVKKVKR